MSEQRPAERGPGAPSAAPGSPSFPASAPSTTGPAPARSGSGARDSGATSRTAGTGPTSSEVTRSPVPGRGQTGLPASPESAATDSGGRDHTDHETTTPAALEVPHTRASATYIGVAVGLVILVLVIIFIAQNLKKANVHFLNLHFRSPLGLVVLAAAVAGGLIVLLVSLARVLQLRLMARRHRRAHENV